MNAEFGSQRELFLEGGDREVLVRRLFAMAAAGYPAGRSLIVQLLRSNRSRPRTAAGGVVSRSRERQCRRVR
jgi:hypothetical protein